jgi:hypothetical protein
MGGFPVKGGDLVRWCCVSDTSLTTGAIAGSVLSTPMKTFLTVIVMLVLPASARIGETSEQLAARYGKSKPGKDASELCFEKNGISICATLWNGMCHSIRFAPVQAARTSTEPAKDAGRELTREEIQMLLDANSGGFEWAETKKNTWITMDAKRSAFIFSDGALCIITAEFIARDIESRKKEEPERTDGF